MDDERNPYQARKQLKRGRFGFLWGTVLLIVAIIIVLLLFPPW